MNGLVHQSGGLVINGQIEVSAVFGETIAKNDAVYVRNIYNQDSSSKLANPTTLPTGTGRGVAFSADGVYMSVAHDVSPFLTIYKRSGDVFTKLTNPTILPTGTGQGVAFSTDGVYMSVAHDVSPFVTIYKGSVSGSKAYKTNLMLVAKDIETLSLGYAKEAGVLNDTKTIVKLWG